MAHRPRDQRKGIDMAGTGITENTVLHAWDLEDLVLWEQLMTAPSERQRRSARPQRVRSQRRPAWTDRPGGAPLAHRGTGVRFSFARGTRRRPVTAAATVGLALLAGLITLWLGVVGHMGGSGDASAPAPDRLAVVQVHSGETLAHVAARVAPDTPVGRVVDRIRELNALQSGSLQAGQTLIAPVN